jgi:murein DD-endopeptidase MepM/ murein hydrolase activator NlpD
VRRRRAAGRDAAAAPPRSDDGQYCWYASWLYATRFQGLGGEPDGGMAFLQTLCPGYPEDEVWLSSDRKTLVLRRAHGDDEVLHRADTPFDWHQAPQFSGTAPARPNRGSDHAEYFVFPRIGAPFLETWAQLTAVLADAAAGLWHLVDMGTSPREYACNIPLWLWNWGRAVTASAGKAPLPSLIAQKAGWGMGGKYLFSPLLAMLTVILGALEGHHSKTNSSKNVFLQYLTMLGGDALNAFTIHTVTQAVRGLSLSLFTLVNYEGPAQKPEHGPDPRPSNWDMAGPVIGLVNTLIGMLVFKLVRREDHGLPIGGNATPFLLWFFLGAPFGAFVGGFCGTLIGWAVSRTVTPAQLWKEPVKAAVIGLLSFLVQLYLAKEGDTDDGRYNPTLDPQGNANGRQPFAGYAEAGNSPYRLPLAAGGTTFVGQANQGFFSHMRYGFVVQVYAYDFAHDFQDEVLAVRDGTVVDWFDFYPDDTELDLSGNTPADTATGQAAANAGQTAGLIGAGQSGFDSLLAAGTGSSSANLTGNWNFVLIRHDSVDPAHDRDQGGTVVVTFAEYGHGANGGVRAAFALRGIAPNAIIGTRVQQGQVVMLAGDSGTSFHNHLHLHVRPSLPTTPVPATPPPATFVPINPTTLANYTVPFVFREGRHVIGRDGPLRHLLWYRSENTRLG